MICSIKFLDKRFANEVRNLVGNDDVKFYSYLGNAIENEDFKEAFKEWYKAKTGKVASLKDKYSSLNHKYTYSYLLNILKYL